VSIQEPTKPLTQPEIAAFRAKIRRELEELTSAPGRFIPLVDDPAIQASEGLVRHCEELAQCLAIGIENQQTRILQHTMANLCESLEITWDVLHTKTAKDTSHGIVIQRQFLTRYEKCRSRFIDVYLCLVSCNPIHDSPQYGFQAWLDCVARGEQLSKAVSDQVLAEGFTDEAYEQINMNGGMAEADALALARPNPYSRRPFSELAQELKNLAGRYIIGSYAFAEVGGIILAGAVEQGFLSGHPTFSAQVFQSSAESYRSRYVRACDFVLDHAGDWGERRPKKEPADFRPPVGEKDARAIFHRRLEDGTLMLVHLLEAEATQVTARAGAPPKEATDRRNDEKARRSLHHKGAGWELRFDETSAVYPEMLGFDYLAILLSKPEYGFEPAELIVKAAKFDGDSRTMRGASEAGKQKGKFGEAQKPARRTEDSVLDDEAAKSYARRLTELPDLMEKAESDAERVKLEEERAFLTDELRKAANRRGVMRKLNPNADRVSVTNAIADALDRINKHQPEAAAWLRANLETGKAPRYFGPGCWDVER
jgi:hypothetical protein